MNDLRRLRARNHVLRPDMGRVDSRLQCPGKRQRFTSAPETYAKGIQVHHPAHFCLPLLKPNNHDQSLMAGEPGLQVQAPACARLS
ncbi:hypothetical protein [Pseudomonas corrugata]|uniref:hypothetical protein n=1 Tax=Pseudomonas corrugata TaxID=47879 RepID=UPI0022344067|nr:hypothetical protein [Pseudomonas corrugata]UZE08363.1 hypothetical protein LOY65_10780 [Pseudomonas corrugata]